MSSRLLAALVALVMLAAVWTLAGTHAGDNPHGAYLARISEDSSGWDCRLMGNRRCGWTPLELLQVTR